jgi:superfamily II DNA or RNA helicase
MDYLTLDKIPQHLLPKALRTKFVVNEEYFSEFDETLRSHQRGSIESIKDEDKGQINIPTGTGKTYIQKHIHIGDMLKKSKQGKQGVYVIAAHRLALCTQLFNEVLDLLIPCGIKADMIYIGSERYNFDTLNKKYKHLGYSVENIEGGQTTSSYAVKQRVEEAKNKGHHCIIVSTYHSFHRLEKLGEIDIVTFDEAHTTTGEQFSKNIELIKPIVNREFYFTATRRVFGENGGQNNEDFYGKVLYEMSPRKAIELGEIVRPRLHFIRSKNLKDIDVTGNETMMVKTVMEAFENHRTKIAKTSCSPKEIGPKILVTVNGLHELHTIHDNEMFQDFCRENKIKCFSFSSDEGEHYNFKSISRQNALDKMSEMNDSEKAIMFHYDILTEGIDLPSITGVLLLRDLPTAKLLQNVGRGARLIKSDRKKLYSEEIKPYELEKMVKPYCWVILPEYLKTLEGGSRMKEMIQALRDTYDIQVELMGEDDDALSKQEHHLPKVTRKDKPIRGDKDDKLLHFFEDFLINELKEEVYNDEDPIKLLEEKLGLIK